MLGSHTDPFTPSSADASSARIEGCGRVSGSVDVQYTLDFVNDFAERGKLKSPQCFVPYLLAGPWVEDTVDVVPIVFVEVVIPQDRISALNPRDVAVGLPADFGDVADERPFERFVDFQNDAP